MFTKHWAPLYFFLTAQPCSTIENIIYFKSSVKPPGGIFIWSMFDRGSWGGGGGLILFSNLKKYDGISYLSIETTTTCGKAQVHEVWVKKLKIKNKLNVNFQGYDQH